MAEMVGSIVVGEVVNRASSYLISRHRDRLSTREGVERLEMAHIKMEAALEVSARWPHAADAPLLRWRRRLRRAADECDAALHRWKLRELQEEEARERLARAPLPSRVAHAVLCFVSALLVLARGGGGGGEASRARATVQRFERLADGAAEFLRYVELNSAPRKRRLFGPAVGKLGEGVEYGVLQGARQCFLGAGSESPAEVWMESNKPCHAYGKRRASGKKLLLV
ncbi:hypothetical protein SEVIR_9G364500v4 [Setaria viridis]|uniref:Rx N-terminal domain-containing protein n=1 Tax=Setaria viridis TaxID=4556 RepID=A0A4U6T5X8_SETVI|nr:uncharacterized protein LOC117836658 [Setaria viridis]TKV95462.1 hypothetical protein SEVIR_9G364500v2 [Setaria viridis]